MVFTKIVIKKTIDVERVIATIPGFLILCSFASSAPGLPLASSPADCASPFAGVAGCNRPGNR
jgi:hypothetical protein